jgi:CubicO group peptidase (beta-lactamase class C family)
MGAAQADRSALTVGYESGMRGPDITGPDSTALPRSTPAEQGVDATGIDGFIDAVAPMSGVELHSMMVVRHGHVVAERWWRPYTPEAPHLLYSASKSFTSTALGFAVAEGLVDLDATVLSYFPEFDGVVTDEQSRSIRVRHVAAMASGHEDDTIYRAVKAGNGDMLLGFLLIPPDRDPGTVFAYNQPCSYALSAIIRRVSGASLTGYLRPRLFEPLGIGAFGWRRDALGRELGYAGLYAPTEALAKVGQLYLRNGEWAGRRLLPAEWVAQATRSHVATNRPDPDWDQGYGFQFWRSRHGYRGDGAFGQFMVILPDADAVVAITSQSPDMQGLLNAMWQHLLPALTAGAGPAGAWQPASPSLSRPRGGGPAGEFVPMTLLPGPGNELAALRTVRLRAGELVLTDTGPELTAELGTPDAWTTTGPLATAYAWDSGQLHVDIVFVETPHRLHLNLNPATGQFEARWQTAPLGDARLSAMRMPR